MTLRVLFCNAFSNINEPSKIYLLSISRCKLKEQFYFKTVAQETPLCSPTHLCLMPSENGTCNFTTLQPIWSLSCGGNVYSSMCQLPCMLGVASSVVFSLYCNPRFMFQFPSLMQWNVPATPMGWLEDKMVDEPLHWLSSTHSKVGLRC